MDTKITYCKHSGGKIKLSRAERASSANGGKFPAFSQRASRAATCITVSAPKRAETRNGVADVGVPPAVVLALVGLRC